MSEEPNMEVDNKKTPIKRTVDNEGMGSGQKGERKKSPKDNNHIIFPNIPFNQSESIENKDGSYMDLNKNIADINIEEGIKTRFSGAVADKKHDMGNKISFFGFNNKQLIKDSKYIHTFKSLQ